MREQFFSIQDGPRDHASDPLPERDPAPEVPLPPPGLAEPKPDIEPRPAVPEPPGKPTSG